MKDRRFSPIRRRYGTLGVAGVLILMLIALAAWLGQPVPAHATPDYLAIFATRYPAATQLNTCATCHTASIPALNAYGEDFSHYGLDAGALATIEPLDSDGDGWTNLQEIDAQTFPGDPNSHPVGATPVPTATPVSSPIPTPTVGIVRKISVYLPVITDR